MLDGRGGALRAYAWRGDLAGINTMLKRGASIDDAGTYDSPPLAVAAASPRAGIETLAFLLDRGAAINFGGTESEKPALFAAARAADEAKVRFLLERGADARLRTSKGYGVLHAAVSSCVWEDRSRGLSVCRLVLDAGAPPDVMSEYGESPVREAARANDFFTVGYLNNAGADLGPLCWTALMRAIALGTADDVARELGAADLGALDFASRNAWLLAVCTGEVDKASLLLPRGGDVNARGWFEATPLHYAVRRDCPQMVEWLISHGAQIDALDGMPSTPLMDAVEHESIECVRALSRLGADVNVDPDADRSHTKRVMSDAIESIPGLGAIAARFPSYDPGGDRAILHARSARMVQVLVELGAEVNVLHGGDTPLGNAADDRDLDRVVALLEGGANVDLTSTGDTALHHATRRNELEMMEVLLRSGANPNAEDVDRDTPLSYRKTREAVDLLLRYGADDSLHGAQSSWDIGE